MEIMPQPAAATAASHHEGGKSKAAGSVIGGDFETFLRMLTTQMENQDPLNPIKSSDYAEQLATFSGVEQQVRTNELLQNLGERLGATGLSQLAGLVGMEARVAAPARFDGWAVQVYAEPDASADAARLVVRDSAGAVVARQDISTATATHGWDGRTGDGSRAANGSYSFEVESYADGALIDAHQAKVFAPVLEARAGPDGAELVLEGGKTVPAAEIGALRRPVGS